MDVLKIFFTVIFGKYAIRYAIVVVNKRKDSFKICKFHLATTEKMGKINLLHWFMKQVKT